MEIIVVANGCTDGTAEVAASFGPGVRVLSLPAAGKQAAMAAGDRAAAGFPRIYLDADVEIGAGALRALAAAVSEPGICAAGPERVLALAGCPWPVRWYYDVWGRLPEVREGLFARGVVAVSQAGHRRLAGLPRLIADDLVASLAFAPGERRIVAGARVVIHPPRRFADLVRRRVRAAQGVSQVERSAGAPRSVARTRVRAVLAIAARRPWLAPRVALFGAVALLARLKARRAVTRSDYSGWQRDESSRATADAGTAPGSR
jgi:glycosyl transferase family 2